MGKDIKGRELGKGISQRKNGRYQARYQDRFGNRKTIYGSTLSEVKKKLAEEKRLDLSRTNVREKMLFRDWYEEWIDICKAPVIRDSSLNSYKGIIKKHILPVFGGMYVCDVRQVDIQKLINDLDERGYGYETQDKVKILMSDLFNVAIENEYALKNPAKSVKVLAEKPNERYVLPRDEEEAFLTMSAGTFYDNLFVTALYTGLRPGEVCALTEEDLDFKKGLISVNSTLLYQKLDGDTKKTFHMHDPKTYTSRRTVPMVAEAKRALKAQITLKQILSNKYPKEGEFADLLFVSSLNTPLCSQTLCDAISRLVKEINLQRDPTECLPQFSAHTFRHTFATRFIENGGDPKVLQKILGHANLQITMDLYVHVVDDFKQDEMDRVTEIMPKANIHSISKEPAFKVV